MAKTNKESDFGTVIRHSVWAFIFLGAATGLQFLFDLVLAREYGAEGSGIFYLSLSILGLLAMIGRVGFDRSVVRFLPPLFAEKKTKKIRGLLKLMDSFTVMSSFVLGSILLLIAPWLAESVFENEVLTKHFRIFALVIPGFALLHVDAGVLRSLKKIRESLIVERIIIYATAILAVVLLTNSLVGVFWGFMAGAYAALLFGRWAIGKSITRKGQIEEFERRLLFSSAMPLFIVSLATLMFGQATLLIIGALADTEAVGIFSIAFKVSMIMNLILVGINSIGATKLSEMYNSGASIQKLVQQIAALSMILAIPLAIIFISAPSQILSLFGDEFTVGASTLIVLTLGQLINTSVGSANHILSVSGHEKQLAGAIGLSLILNIVLSFILIPAHGILGAGVAVAISIAVSNISQLLLIKKYLGLWSLPFPAIAAWLRR